MKPNMFSAAIAGLVAFSGTALAQLPNSKVLTMDVAQVIAQGAMEKCRADGYKVTVLVVDGLNAPKALLRDDGATASTTEVAKMKATATMLYTGLRVLLNLFRPGRPLPQQQFQGRLTHKAVYQ